MSESYSPFPDTALNTLATTHAHAATMYPERSSFREQHQQYATACRNAIASHDAVRERCLVAELDNRMLRGGIVGALIDPAIVERLRTAQEFGERTKRLAVPIDLRDVVAILAVFDSALEQLRALGGAA